MVATEALGAFSEGDPVSREDSSKMKCNSYGSQMLIKKIVWVHPMQKDGI